MIIIITEATPTAETISSLSPQSEALVVYVKKKSEQYDVPDNLNWMIEDLQQVFMDNMHETKKSFRSLNISEVIDYILSYVPSLLSPRF